MKSSAIFTTSLKPEAKTASEACPMPNALVPATLREVAPQVKPFMHCDAATWLLAELDYDDVSFGLYDLEQSFSELGYGITERAAA